MGYCRKLSATHKQRIAQSMKGKKHTEETKRKISKKIKALWAYAEENNKDIKNTDEEEKV